MNKIFYSLAIKFESKINIQISKFKKCKFFSTNFFFSTPLSQSVVQNFHATQIFFLFLFFVLFQQNFHDFHSPFRIQISSVHVPIGGMQIVEGSLARCLLILLLGLNHFFELFLFCVHQLFQGRIQTILIFLLELGALLCDIHLEHFERIQTLTGIIELVFGQKAPGGSCDTADRLVVALLPSSKQRVIKNRCRQDRLERNVGSFPNTISFVYNRSK